MFSDPRILETKHTWPWYSFLFFLIQLNLLDYVITPPNIVLYISQKDKYKNE